MSDVDKDKLADIYNDLHLTIKMALRGSHDEEAFEATKMLLATIITTRCVNNHSNLEQFMDDAFDDVADWIYHLAEKS